MNEKQLPWEEGIFPPLRIFGNLYFAGSVPASVHLIDTGDGLVVLDTGYQHSLFRTVDNIYRLGLDPHDIRLILLTHGHIDHFGAARALKELTGARIALGWEDADAAAGRNDLSYAGELGMRYEETFEPDILLHDGDTVSLGDTRISCAATRGHTEGAMSFFFPVTDGKETFRAALHGGMGINTLTRDYLTRHHLPFSLRDDFRASMRRLNREKVDLFLGNHMYHNHTSEKAEWVRQGDAKAFIVPGEWQEYNLWCIENLDNMVRGEEEHEN